ncbi:site-specific DNA-methyltransferase, partial [Pseudomonas aeruginosa]|nr:site-specific DNA-methyltransferase [Pseudomonas aeruginosa]NQA48000.1 site-specific DNA-methyltransferase [Pseudomonas aeruginosa]
MTLSHEIRVGDCLDTLRAMPDQSFHCCITSPPYFGLRDYGMASQIGLEQTPAEFVARLVEV